MPRWPRTTIRSDANRRSCKGEMFLLRAPINAIGRRKPRAYKEQCVRRPHALHALERRKRTWTNERPIRPGQGRRGPTYDNNSQFRPQNGSQRGTFARRGSFHSSLSRQNSTKCGYCGKLGHHEEECRKKMCESASTSRQLRPRNTRTILTTKIITECTVTTPTTKIVTECMHATPTVVECS